MGQSIMHNPVFTALEQTQEAISYVKSLFCLPSFLYVISTVSAAVPSDGSGIDMSDDAVINWSGAICPSEICSFYFPAMP